MSRAADVQSPAEPRTTVVANYTKFSENIRRLAPQGIQCSVFCGGTNCKYENPENWKADSLALQGIYSHWITDDILAMARPSTAVIIKKNIIQQFQSLGIRSIINLQCPNEHASCGEPLENSGFSYDPNLFMENNVYYYNFALKDYEDASLSELLNMVKVLAFAITEGRVAIHCHAGLGRTGVLIACYLVYSLHVAANDAIKYVRLRRPGSVQTRGQIVCVRHFAQFILPQTVTYYIKENKNKYMTEFTLQTFLKKQKIILHGYEERNFKFLPKIIHVICERILQLCGCYTQEFLLSSTSLTNNFFYSKLTGNNNRHESIYSISSFSELDGLASPDSMNIPSPNSSYACGSLPVSPSPSECEDPTYSSQFNDSILDLNTLNEEVEESLLMENKCFKELQTQKSCEEAPAPEKICDVSDVTTALLSDFENFDVKFKHIIMQFQIDLNSSQLGWARLRAETNLCILAALLFDWLEKLKTPVLGKENLEIIVVHYKHPENCLKKFSRADAYLIEYLLKFLLKLQPMSEKDQENILLRIVASLTQQSVLVNGKLLPTGKGFNRLREGTFNCTAQFFKALLPLIDAHHKQYIEESSSLLAWRKNSEDSDDFNTDQSFQ